MARQTDILTFLGTNLFIEKKGVTQAAILGITRENQ